MRSYRYSVLGVDTLSMVLKDVQRVPFGNHSMVKVLMGGVCGYVLMMLPKGGVVLR